MRIVSIEPLQCSNGWSPWTFVRVETDTGLVGYGECSDWQMPRAWARVSMTWPPKSWARTRGKSSR